MPPKRHRRDVDSRSFSVLLLAAGLSTRMKSKRAKVLHELGGQPLISHVIHAIWRSKPSKIMVVLGHQADEVRRSVEVTLGELAAEASEADSKPTLPPAIEFILQSKQRGTGHAVMVARENLEGTRGPVLLLYGDVPFIHTAILERLLATHRKERATLSFITTRLADPSGYGRVVRDRKKRPARIVEERDCNEKERRLKEINTGIYAFEPESLLRALDRLRRENRRGEIFLTSAVELLRDEGKRVEAICLEESENLLGINTRQELAQAEATLRARVLARVMEGGVTISDPSSTYIDPRVRVGQDTIIHPHVIIEGPSRVGEDCVIESFTCIKSSLLGDRVHLRPGCLVANSRLGDDSTVGPFAHLRMHAELDGGATVGNFVEVKNSRLGSKSKSMHLTYLGDATIGERVNIGAGTVTCNYDGKHKHPTFIEDDARIGSDTMLIAPVRVGRGAVTGAGSVVTKDLPPNTLAVGVPAVIKKHLP